MTLSVDHRALDHDVELPLSVELGSDELLTYVDLLRLVPGRRAVFRAQWTRGDSNQVVVAKAFFGSRSRRSADREERGLGCLNMVEIPTPLVLARRRGAHADVVLLEDLGDLRRLDEPRLTEVRALLSKMAERAIRHADLHRGNLLTDGRRLVLLDGGAVRSGRFDVIDALAKWQSEFPFVAANADCAALAELNLARVRAHRVGRGRRIFAKSFRETTAITTGVRAGSRWYALRSGGLASFDAATAAANSTEYLKSGRTATVVRAGDLVIKRGNRKSWWHGLRTSLRASRAARSWGMSHAAGALGIPVPAPLALSERRIFGYRTESFYTYTYVEGEPLDRHVARSGWGETLVDAVVELFARFVGCGFIHGDCKASNFIVTEEKTLVVVDLDASSFEISESRACAKHERDIRRFLANWADTEPRELRARLEGLLSMVAS